MNCPKVDKCCWYFDLSTGAKILGWIGIVMNAIIVLVYAIALTAMITLMNEVEKEEKLEGVDDSDDGITFFKICKYEISNNIRICRNNNKLFFQLSVISLEFSYSLIYLV